RANSYPAQLHPPLAAAIAMIAKEFAPTKIIDPFCGSGTILIESAMMQPSVQHIGYDIAGTAIETATANAIQAGVEVALHKDDFFNHYVAAGDYFIVSNPPWGEKHDIKGKDEFFERLSAEISQSK